MDLRAIVSTNAIMFSFRSAIVFEILADLLPTD